jgi:Coenzyme PQQ synthesis protein D (PqqD)
MEAANVYQRSDDVVCRQVGSESILVPIRNHVGNLESIFVLSPVAALVWSRIDGRTSVAQLADAVCAEYDVDRDTARRDVEELIGALEEIALVRMVTP